MNNKIVFLTSMMLGTLMSISSLSWFSSWMGLEINLLSFLPLMNFKKNKFSSESSMKYFIIQTMASSLLLFSTLMMLNMKPFEISKNIEYLSSLMINSSLLLKLGTAPFHFWLPEVISGLNWEMSFIIFTWQKMAPMILLTYTIYFTNFFMIFIIFSSVISGIQGLNQTCLRKILTYSSINHMSWMISSLINSINIWWLYFIIYSIINLNIILIFKKYNMYKLSQMNMLMSFNKKIKFFFFMNFLSLSGLPPFLGFFPKWITIQILMNNNFYFMTMMMIMLTLISMYMYMRMMFSTLTMNYQESLIKNFKKLNLNFMIMNFIFLTTLLIFSINPMF